MESLDGCVAVVTGAGMGLGRALAHRLRREGAHIALCDVNMGALEEVKDELLSSTVSSSSSSPSASSSSVLRSTLSSSTQQRRITLHGVDVADRTQVASLVEEVTALHGPCLHLLINNAGIVRFGAWDRMSTEVYL